MEDLILNMVANAPAVAVLIYLVWRLDSRLEELEDALIQLLVTRFDT